MRTRRTFGRWLGAACAGALLFSSGCKDAGVAHYQKARDQYRALLEQSKRPSDPAFDPVIRELSQVPPKSKVYADAQRMLKPLEAARQTPPPVKPLVEQAPAAPEPPDVAAQRQHCIELSQRLGEAQDAKAREVAVNSLKVCQLELEKAQESHHSDNP
jgi:hypothetical protein